VGDSKAENETGTTFRMKPTVIITFSLLALQVLAIPARAQSGAPPRSEPLVLTDAQGKYPLGLHMEVLKDPGG